MLEISEELILDMFHDAAFKVQHHEYSSFGVLQKVTDENGGDISASPKIDPYFTFSGREYDKETGLYYYRARYYNPEIGRFLQTDPDTGKLSNPITHINKYVYVGNNPVNLIDPTGRTSTVADVWSAVWNTIKFGVTALIFPIAFFIDPAWALGNLMKTFNLSIIGQALNLAFMGRIARESSFQGRATLEHSMFSFGFGFTMGPVSFLPNDARDWLRYHEIGHQLQYERDGGWKYLFGGINAQWISGSNSAPFECEAGTLSKKEFNLTYFPDTNYDCSR